MKIKSSIDIDLEKWQSFCNRSEFISPFQTYDFFCFFNSLPNASAEVFAVEENCNYTSLAVVTIQKESGFKGFFSRRGIIYGGPLLEKNRKSLDVLLKELIKHFRSRLIYLEIRNFFDYSQYSDVFSVSQWKFIPYLNSTIKVGNKNLADLLKDMKYNRRREIKISLEQNAKYKECETEEELEKIYQILKDLYTTRVKLPIPDLVFFEKLWKSPVGRVFAVVHNNQIIGGSFCLVLNGYSVYTMYYCGLREYNKKIFPTHLAVVAALDYACQNGCKIFDFMGAGLKGEEYGVRSYKQEFGGDLNEFGRYRIILNSALFKLGEVGIKILKKTK